MRNCVKMSRWFSLLAKESRPELIWPTHFRNLPPVLPLPVVDISQKFDVIVVGGGHAGMLVLCFYFMLFLFSDFSDIFVLLISGCEAAAAASRVGAKTLLVTHKASTIGEMSVSLE